VLRPGEVLASVRLHDWLVAHLPAQMIPTRFLFLDALPLSPAGKLNRNELRLAAETVVAAAGGRELTSTEAALSEIWQRLLKLETVAPDDHFFSIGGDSLAAVRMTLEVEAALGVELSVPMLFESPTLEKLALRLERIRGEVDPPSKAGFILPLSVASPGRPLFFNAVDLRMAGRERWRVPCPLYSVSHWAQGVGFLDADSIEDLARRQIVGIRETQPSGPYRIAGYSFGGLVAREIAQQLQDVGEEVEFLFLLDPMQPYRTLDNPEFLGDEPFEFPDRGPWGARLARKLRILVSQPKRLPNYLAMRLVWHFEHSAAAQWLVYKVVHLHGRKPNPVSFWLLPKNRWPAFWYGAQRMARGYTARAFSGRVLAVFPEQGKRVGVWREFINADAETHIVSAAHDGMFTDPAAADWMEVLTRFVEGDLPPVGRRDVIGVAAKALAREDELD
ncbi:MAG: thioesterase domain-containing protein, partial [Verrucomicrobiales bacterium]|nr:thioesterase domain-containing protein [Verrucomicrobiales bacterium]